MATSVIKPVVTATEVNELKTKLTKVSAPVTSGFTVYDRGSYMEDGVYHLLFSASLPLGAQATGSYITVAFCSYVPPATGLGATTPIVYGYGNDMYPTVAKVTTVNSNKCVQVFVTSAIHATGNVTGTAYVKMDFQIDNT